MGQFDPNPIYGTVVIEMLKGVLASYKDSLEDSNITLRSLCWYYKALLKKEFSRDTSEMINQRILDDAPSSTRPNSMSSV